MRKIAWVGFALLTMGAQAEVYTEPSTVKGITFGAGYVRVKLDAMLSESKYDSSVEQCITRTFYSFDASTEFGRQAYSALLSAKMAGAKVSLQLNGCYQVGNNIYPKINHVYVCDTLFCS